MRWLVRAVVICVAVPASAETIFNRPTHGFSKKEWSALSPDVRECHVRFGPYAADLGNSTKLARCLSLGGYTALTNVEADESRERTRKLHEEAERIRRETQERERQNEMARAQAEERARQLAASRAEARERARKAEEARLAARPPAEIEAERRTAALRGERLKISSMAQVRDMHKDPDSVRFGDTRMIFNRDGTKVLAICGTVSGTNGFGARVSGPWLFSTESDHVYIRGPDGWSGAGLSLWSQHCR